MKSMTGFGRVDFRDETADISVEIKTVNHRFKDFFIKIPRMLNPVEDRIRRTIGETIARGRIEVFIKYSALGEGAKKVVYNKALAQNYLDVLNALKQLDSMISDELDVGLVARFPDVVTVEEVPEDSDNLWEKLAPVLTEALAQVDESRRREGANLKEDIRRHLDAIKTLVDAIRLQAPAMLTAHTEELRKKVEEYTASVGMEESRILTEVAVMADKLAIDEELTRLDSHTARMTAILDKEEGPVGRKLDFLVQEMNREINTIGSKAADITISEKVVDVKSEIEKIREQIQNIE